MKFLAILQIVCILFLSAYSTKTKTAVHTAKFACCEKFGKTEKCPKSGQKQDNCDGQACSMLLTCGICGFLTVEPVTVKPATFIIIKNPVTTYKAGNPAGYFPSDWKPPKV